jgi:hypothetical protein
VCNSKIHYPFLSTSLRLLREHACRSSVMSTTTSMPMDSRSSSPTTPESSDGHHPVTLHHDHNLSTWYNSIRPRKTFSEIGVWDNEPMRSGINKPDSERMLQLDDLIDEHAYEEYVLKRFSCPIAVVDVLYTLVQFGLFCTRIFPCSASSHSRLFETGCNPPDRRQLCIYCASSFT